MKTEEATCKVAPSPTQISNPLYNVKDGVIEDSPHTGVTYSPCSIESPESSRHFITPQESPKDYRRCWLNWQIAKNKNLTPMGVRLLVILVGEIWQSKDNKMIVSDDELADILITSPKVIRETMNLLIAEKLIERLLRGSAIKGRPRICSQYVLGSVFAGVPLMMRGKDKGKPYPKAQRGYSTTPLNKGTTGVLQLPRQGERATPSPICTLNTHTKKSPSAFTKENWLKECQRLNPSRDLKDIDYTFHLAESEGANDDNWMLSVRRYDRSYNPRSKIPTAPARPSPIPRPAVKSSCESPKQARLDYNDPKILEEALFVALSNGETPACILASVKDPALAQSARAKAEARVETSRNRSRMP